MKVAILLLLSALAAHSQIRIVGTNLYDFTPANRTTNSIYHVCGQVWFSYPDLIWVERLKAVRYVFVGDPKHLFSKSELEKFDLGFKVKGLARDISYAEWRASKARALYRRYELFEQVPVINHKAVVGETVCIIAVPTTSKVNQFTVFDAGTPYTGSTNNFTFIYTVYPNHIQSLRVRKPGEVTLQNQKRTSQTNDSQ